MVCRWHIDECSPYWLAGWVDDDGPVEIDVSVNGRHIARFGSNDYREDLAKVGFGDGRRSFFFPISHYLSDSDNLVTISRGELVLHSATLQPVAPERKRAAIARATSAQGGGQAADDASRLCRLQMSDDQGDRLRMLVDDVGEDILAVDVTEESEGNGFNRLAYVVERGSLPIGY